MHQFHNKLKVIRRERNPTSFKASPIVAYAGAGSKDSIYAIGLGLENNVRTDVIGKMISHARGDSNAGRECSLLVVTEASVWHLSLGKMIIKVKEITSFPFAIGSGTSVTKFAMENMGATAFGAVACAINADKSSGGKINLYNCREPDRAPRSEEHDVTAEDFLAIMAELKAYKE
jgi:hypothetical protein